MTTTDEREMDHTECRDCGGLPALPALYLRPALLLLIKEQPSYGYDLAARVASLGLNAQPPALYKVLRSMEDGGSITSEWEFSNTGPARRIYRITAHGDATLVGLVGHLEQTRHRLTHLLERCGQVSNGHSAP